MSTSYIASFVSEVSKVAKETSNLLMMGENIDNGSRLSGLARGLECHPTSTILNIGNCEYTHCGVGFGMMVNGRSSVLFSKQLDFMLLGSDHFVSTYNFIRSQPNPRASQGSFTIVCIICDQGLQGPQSSFNALGDICSMARVDGFTLTNADDAALIVANQLVKPGFRFITVSQRLFSTAARHPGIINAAPDCGVLQYEDGEEATILCSNFAMPYGLDLREKCSEAGLSAALFSVNYLTNPDLDLLRASIAKTGRVMLIDDSKSSNLYGVTILDRLRQQGLSFSQVVVARERDINQGVSADSLAWDANEALDLLRSCPRLQRAA
jgi:hypothetical protein